MAVRYVSDVLVAPTPLIHRILLLNPDPSVLRFLRSIARRLSRIGYARFF
jgi:hypothetical protein